MDEELEELRRKIAEREELKRKRHREKIARLRAQWTPEQRARRKEMSAQWNKKNNTRRVAENVAKRHANKVRAVATFNNICNHCAGTFHPAVFEFHHVGGDEKQQEVGRLLSGRWERIQAELRKCIMLCANCHRLVHAKEDGWIVNNEC